MLADIGVETVEATRDEAEKMGAIAFFGDKYGESVRVVRAGPTSLEFCGGTHVDSLGQIGPITLLSEGSIGSNTRRIFAVTGKVAIERAKERERLVRAAAELLRSEPDELVAAIGRTLERQRDSERELAKLRQQSSEAEAGTLAAEAAADGGVVVARRDNVEGKALQNLAQAVLRHDGVRAVVLGGSPDGAKVAIAAATGGEPDATQLVKTLGQLVGGGGGGTRRGRAGRRQGPLADRGRAGRGAATAHRVSGGGDESGQARGRVAAIDLGARRIGIAYSDSGRTLASPWGTIERSGDADRDRQAVVAAVRECEAGTLVVGLPLSLSGQAGPAARAALDEAEALRVLLEPLGVDRGDGGRALHHGRGRARHARRGPHGQGRPQGGRQRGGHGAAPVLAGPLVTGPFDGDEEQPLAPTDDAGDAELAGPPPHAPVDDEPSAPLTRAERKGARSARVRRRRRIVAAVGGALLVLILAFVLWYELESHALGPRGPPGGRHRARGRRIRLASIDALSQAHVIGSSLAFRISNVVHGAPNPVPGSYALHQNQSFSAGPGHPRRRPQHLPGRRPARASPCRRWRARWTPFRVTPRGVSPPRPTVGPCIRSSRPPVPTTSRACWGRATTSSCPARAT